VRERTSGCSRGVLPRRAAGRGLIDDLPCPVLALAKDGRLRFANAAALALLGLAPADVGRKLLERLGVGIADQRRIERRLALLRARRPASVRVWIATADAARRALIWRVSCRHDARGRLIGFVALGETAPLRRGPERRPTKAEQGFAQFVPPTPDWFWESDARHRFTYLSERIETPNGMPRAGVSGRMRPEITTASLPPEIVARHAADLAAHRPFQDLTVGLSTDGRQRLVRVSGRPVFGEDGGFLGYRGVGWELDGQEAAAARVRFLVRHDPLTGLVNRQALGESLAAALRGAKRNGGGIALFALDLEDFKRVNDSYGHRIGDLLLQQAAARLGRCVAGHDIVARLGGDEFAVVMPLAKPTKAIALAAGERIAERLREPFGIDGHEIHCGVRVGITLSPLHGNKVEALLHQADLALHEAKRHDQRLCMFGVELSAATQRRKSIEDALRRALERDEMSLVLQPQFAVRSQRLIGCEALLRWRHGRPDEIGPGVFVPIAEETGLIVAFGSWILGEACRLAAGWWQGGAGPRIAVNLSPVQFWNRDLCHEVEQALAAAKLPPRALELEITEGVLMRDTQSAAATLNKLNELGVAIALDDFGTGYSSLSYLKRFPIHRLKIDQTFIRDLDHDADDRQIAKAIIGLGHSLNLEVVAEGVETERQLAFLADLDCDVAQGYYFSPPIRVEAFKSALDSGQWRGREEARSCELHHASGLGRREPDSPLRADGHGA
jgi:diguanylate cyclase (GGDEF)-like protein/PAS domain S-box-containing protein